MLATTTFAFLSCKIYFIKLIGVGIAIAVLLDAVLVPTSIKLFGEYNFYCPDVLRKVVAAVDMKETEEFADSLELEEDVAIAALTSKNAIDLEAETVAEKKE